MPPRTLTLLRQCLLVLAALLSGGFCLAACAAPSLVERLDALSANAVGNTNKTLAELQRMKSEVDAGTPADKREYLGVLGYVHMLLGDDESAMMAAAELETLARQQDDHDALAAAFLVRSNAHLSKGRYPESDADSRRAIDLLTEQSPLVLRYWAALSRGQATGAVGRTGESLTQYHLAAELSEKLGQPRRRALVLNHLSNTYLSMQLPDKALSTIREACRLDREIDDKAALAFHRYTESMVYRALGQYAKQREALEESLRLWQAVPNKFMVATALGALSDYFLSVGKYQEALRHARQTIVLAKELDGSSLETVSHCNIGLALTYLGQHEEGRREVEIGIATYEAQKDKASVLALLREYGTALDKSGQIEHALKILLRERALRDEQLQAERQQIILELQVKYESDKQQREIALLNRENALKSAALENRTLQQRVWWLAVIALALFSLVVGLLYRRVRQVNIRLAERNAELAIQSSRDPLTGLFNRRHFQNRMMHFQAERDARSGKVELAALYLIDIDHFKRINDRLGHAAGDAVLIALSNRLRDALREADMIVRWGGEEFLVYVPAIPMDRIDDVAVRIIAAIADHPVAYDGKLIHVTASVGYATSPLEPGDVQLPWEREINLIDMALYLAKAHGRSRAFGIRKLRKSDEASLAAIEKDLEQAWNNGLVDLVVSLGPPTRPVE